MLSSTAYTSLIPAQKPESSLKWHSRLIFDESAAVWSLQKTPHPQIMKWRISKANLHPMVRSEAQWHVHTTRADI